METFNDFLSTARTDRFRQLNVYKDKDYLVDDKYRMTENVTMSYYGEYGCQVSLRDFYFYITESKGNAYYSVIELYQLLDRIVQKEGYDFVINLLREIEKAGVARKHEDYIIYRGIRYSVRTHVEPIVDGEIEILDGSISLNYKKLTGLLILIQEKSNYFWNSKKANKKYKDGLLRLFIALITLHQDHPVLENKGWKYSIEEDKFKYVGKFSSDEKKAKRVYYLTKGELDDIMSSES
ncbi:MAG: hypothetical protein PUH12_07955 [Lachnospiraceae bacterium]|nr:hypothetical protein [Lachnospiraceae bacterium]